ncbi:MAG: hypothetical protein L0Y37_05050 [Bacteroidales bacterium]|nr:hypothetical protein [Bacteroidales bacterium]
MNWLQRGIKKYNPAVKKEYLLLPAGLVWMGVGLMLCYMAFRWLQSATHPVVLAAAGIVAGTLISLFGFRKIARHNIERIEALPGNRCFFSFMTVKSYLLVLVMMSFGIALRHSSLPKEFLAVIYISIGFALALSSISYFKSYRPLIK